MGLTGLHATEPCVQCDTPLRYPIALDEDGLDVSARRGFTTMCCDIPLVLVEAGEGAVAWRPKWRSLKTCDLCGTELELVADGDEGHAASWGERVRWPGVRPEARTFMVHSPDICWSHR